MKKFVALAPELSADANPKTIHDVRVWSRRLQQAISAFFPQAAPRQGAAIETGRLDGFGARSANGVTAMCCSKIVAKQQRRTRSEAKRRAWGFVRETTCSRSAVSEVARGRKNCCVGILGNYAAVAQKLIDRPPDESPEILMQRLCDSVQEAWTQWQSACTRAQETRAVNDLHAFRIATKDLRYRTERCFTISVTDN